MTYTWDYGIDTSLGSPGTFYLGKVDTNSHTDYSLHVQQMHGLRAGLDISVTRVRMIYRLFTNVVTQARFGLWDISGSAFTAQADVRVWDRTGWNDTSDTSVKELDLSSSPANYTIGSKTIMGVLADRNAVPSTDDTKPGIRGIAVTATLAGNTYERMSILAAADPLSFTVGVDATNSTASNRATCFECRFTTEQNLVTDIASPHSSGTNYFLIPALVSGNDTYCIKLEDVVVGAGNALTIDMMDTTAASSTPTASMTAYFDDGGGNSIGFSTDEIPGGFASGDTYDIIIQINASTGSMKMCWLNKTTGEGNISIDDHTTKDFDAYFAVERDVWRSQIYGTPRILRLSGTATVGRLQVAAFPIIAHFDSQGLGSTPLTVNSGRLIEALNTAWGTADKQMWWYSGGGSGGRMASANAAKQGTLQYFDIGDTGVGVYDVKEIRGRHVVQTCINDFASSASSLLATMQAIADEVLALGDTVVFTDAPPAASVYFTAAESEAIKQHSAEVYSMFGYNAAVFGVESSWQYFRGPISGGVYQPKNPGVWFEADPDLTHYKAAGAAEKAVLLAPIILDGGESLLIVPEGQWGTTKRRIARF